VGHNQRTGFGVPVVLNPGQVRRWGRAKTRFNQDKSERFASITERRSWATTESLGPSHEVISDEDLDPVDRGPRAHGLRLKLVRALEVLRIVELGSAS
jgi:hypothetical protein